jgi:hypothetical protein
MITNQTERLNFASTKNIPAYPDFLDVQVKSFQDFFQLETKSDERGMKDFIIPSWKIFQLQIQEILL